MSEQKQQQPRLKSSTNQNNKLENMRAVNFSERLVFDVPGSVFQNGLAVGDVDNDGDNELVVGTSDGDLIIFKGTEIWHKTTNLGLITCIAIGDIFNYGRNALVVICGDGWVHIFYSPRSVNPSNGNSFVGITDKIGGNNDQFTSDSDQFSGKIECVHLQRIPTNTKIVLIADVDRDGANEMIIGLTDRIVRSYRWSSADLGSGKLIGLNKWECANQIGALTLQHTCDGTPTLLVAQPGGTFMRIKCNPDDCKSQDDNETKNEVAAASCVDYQTLGISRARNPNISTEILGNLEPGSTEYLVSDESPPKFVPKKLNQTQSINDNNSPTNPSNSLEFRRNYSQPEMAKQNIDELSTDKEKLYFPSDKVSPKFYSRVNSPDTDQVDGNILGGNIILGGYDTNKKKSLLPSYEDFSRDNDNKIENENNNYLKIDADIFDKDVGKSKPYAIATLDGTIMLVKDEIILWSMQVDHQIFALSRLDVTGNGSDNIVACAWDGQTYILDQARNCIRFQLNEPVRSFCTGNYSLSPGTSTPSLIYNTFSNKIFLYHDVVLPSLTIKSLSPLDCLSREKRELVDKLFDNCTDVEKSKKLIQLTNYLLYEINSDDDSEIDFNIC